MVWFGGITMKCVATIVDRHYLGENAYIFSFNNCLLGDYNEEYDIFTDKNGNEYLRSLDPSTLFSEVPQGFLNVVKIMRMIMILIWNILRIKIFEEILWLQQK